MAVGDVLSTTYDNGVVVERRVVSAETATTRTVEVRDAQGVVLSTFTVDRDLTAENATAIVSNLESRLVGLQAIIDRPATTLADNTVASIRQAIRDLQAEVKTLARVDRLQTRKLLTLLDAVD